MWDALIGAGASILGGAMNMFGQQSSNQQNVALAREMADRQQQNAREQMAFQERMSSTAYQRSMADMKSAGLNPILAYSQGGATAPPGAMGGGVAATVENETEGLGEGISSAAQKAQAAMSARLAAEQVKQSASQTDLNKANEALTKGLELKAAQDTATSAQQQQKLDADTKLTNQHTLNAVVNNAILGHQVTSASGEARIKIREASDVEKYGTSRLGRDLGGGVRIFDTIMDALKTRAPQPAPSAQQNAPKSLQELRPDWFKK